MDRKTRRALKAIRKEFGRYADRLPSLTNGRFSSGTSMPTGVNEFFEFEKYKEAHSADELNDLYGQDMWEWEGVCDPQFSDGTIFSLGIYLGEMDYLECYKDIATTVYSVLSEGPSRERLGLPSFNADVLEDKSLQWNWVLHHFADFGIPLLDLQEGEISQREMLVWCSPRKNWLWEDFVPEPEAMRLRPRRPSLWFLTHGVFSASVTAINVLLHPSRTLTLTRHLESSILNPLLKDDGGHGQPALNSVQIGESDRNGNTLSSSSEIVPDNFFIFDGEFWKFRFSIGGETTPQTFSDNIGFHHWAKLLNSPSHFFDAADFSGVSSNMPLSDSRKQYVVSEMILNGELSDSLHQLRFEKDEDDQNEMLLEWVKNLKGQLSLAQFAGDVTNSERLEKQILETSNMIRSIRGKGGELRINLSVSQKKNAKNRIAVALKRAIEKIEEKMPVLAKHLKQCQNPEWGFCYESPPNCHWHVSVAPRK